jgi:hypothetical protein
MPLDSICCPAVPHPIGQQHHAFPPAPHKASAAAGPSQAQPGLVSEPEHACVGVTGPTVHFLHHPAPLHGTCLGPLPQRERNQHPHATPTLPMTCWRAALSPPSRLSSLHAGTAAAPQGAMETEMHAQAPTWTLTGHRLAHFLHNPSAHILDHVPYARVSKSGAQGTWAGKPFMGGQVGVKVVAPTHTSAAAVLDENRWAWGMIGAGVEDAAADCHVVAAQSGLQVHQMCVASHGAACQSAGAPCMCRSRSVRAWNISGSIE